MKKFLKKCFVSLVFVAGISFAFPQNAAAGKDPFGNKGWICASNKDFNITLFRDGTIWIIVYEVDGSKSVSIYDPTTGTWYSNRWTSTF